MHPALRRSAAFALALALAACTASRKDGSAEAATVATGSAVRPGIEVLFTDSLALVKGKRVGLITNHTGVFHYGPGRSAGAPRETGRTIDALFESPDVDLVALFGPEHGITSLANEGDTVYDAVDESTGLPVYSLYGRTLRPTHDMLRGIDMLLFDMQDVGARYYTYPSTMAYAMEAAGEAGIPFVVLDRPNPIRGDVVQGNVLNPAFSSFMGLYPIPMRHGMTVGELARMFVGEFGIHVELHVIPVEGWRRDMAWDETGLPWIPPSLNLPTLASALAYPGTCLLEGTPLSVGRGTDRAFQWVGAPWLDGQALADTLNGYGFAGIRFEPATFTPHTPSDGKFDGVEVHGVRIVASSTDYDAPRVAVAIIVQARRLSGDRWSWRARHFDTLAGTDRLRLGIEAGEGVRQLTASWAAQIAAFRKLRQPYLIYP